MHELDDHDLLRQYAEQNSEAAFAALVARHVDKVYSTALRHTRNAHAAEEITQAVFVILAKKSGRLGAKVILAGWLYETARLTAVTYIRSEIRRGRREQESHMQTTLNENAAAWPHIATLLDDALAGLSAADRHAVVLRYFDGKSLGEVGAAMGASEDAAKKRVTRAVEKLRGWFTKRGVTLTATVLTAAISANSVQAAPLGLATTVTAAAAKGAAVSGSILTLINGALKVMAWTKMKSGIVAGGIVLLTAGTATIAVKKGHLFSSGGYTWQLGEIRLPSGEILQPNSTNTVVTALGDWIWEPNPQNLERVPPLLLLQPSKKPAKATPFEMFGTNRYLATGKTVKELFAGIYAQKDSQAKITFLAVLPEDKFDCLVTVRTNWWIALEWEINQRFGLTTRLETHDTGNVVIVEEAK